MGIAQRLDGLTQFVKDDFKMVFEVRGFDMTGTDAVFAVGYRNNDSVLFGLSVWTLLVLDIDDDGVPTSVMQFFAPQSDVQDLWDAIVIPEDPGGDIDLEYNFRVSELPGDAGTDAETTLLYGSFILKGAIDNV